jgi:hypothetical protein
MSFPSSKENFFTLCLTKSPLLLDHVDYIPIPVALFPITRCNGSQAISRFAGIPASAAMFDALLKPVSNSNESYKSFDLGISIHPG